MDEPVARLLRAAAALESCIGRRTCLIGGLARNVYAERRATADVDVIVDTPDLAEVLLHAADVGLVAVPREVEALSSRLECEFCSPIGQVCTRGGKAAPP